MQSHELARQLLAQPDAPVRFQVGHEIEEGDLLPDVFDLSFSPIDGGLIVVEVGDADHPAMSEA